MSNCSNSCQNICVASVDGKSQHVRRLISSSHFGRKVFSFERFEKNSCHKTILNTTGDHFIFLAHA